MVDAIIASDKLTGLLNELQDRIKNKPWKSLNRQGFVYASSNAISILEEALQFVESIAEEYDKLEGAPSSKEVESSCRELIVLLKKNRELEKSKEGKETPLLFEMKERIVEKEMYSHLEQRVLDFILKARYWLDKVIIYEKKRNLKPIEGKSARKNILDLLEQKESELEELKKKYSELRARSHIGLIEEKTVADLEKEYYDEVRKQDAELKMIINEVSSFEKEIESLAGKYLAIKNALSKVEELSSRQIESSSELIKYLKKERDYAKKLVLEIENETIRLRSAYSKELLSLNEEKEIAKHEAYEKFRQQLIKAKREIEHKDAAIKDLREVVKSKEEKIAFLSKKIADLEKENKRLEEEKGKKRKNKLK